MNKSIEVVLDFNIDDVEFDYKKIKARIFDLFSEPINLQVEEFENVEFEDEDFFIEISAFNYDDGEGNKNYMVSLEIDNNKREKDLTLEISEKGRLSNSKFNEALDELFSLVTIWMGNKINS